MQTGTHHDTCFRQSKQLLPWGAPAATARPMGWPRRWCPHRRCSVPPKVVLCTPTGGALYNLHLLTGCVSCCISLAYSAWPCQLTTRCTCLGCVALQEVTTTKGPQLVTTAHCSCGVTRSASPSWGSTAGQLKPSVHERGSVTLCAHCLVAQPCHHMTPCSAGQLNWPA